MGDSGSYPELKQALLSFRELFIKRILPPSAVNGTAEFLKRCRLNPNWSPSDAHRVYELIKPHTLTLKKVGFDFDTVPKVTIQIPKSAYYENKSFNLIGYDDNLFVIKFPYSRELYKEISSIEGARWNQEKKYWNAPLGKADEVKAFGEKFGFIVTEKGKSMFRNINDNLEASYNAENVELNLPLKLPLYPFQNSGADYGIKNKRVIFGDEMGLGKTVEAIATVLGTDTFPSLVICPKSLRYNWEDEWAKFTNKKVLILDKKRMPMLKQYIELGLMDVGIINYDGARTLFTDHIQEIEITKGARAGKTNKKVITKGYENLFKSIIIDEAHECRNRSTLRFKTIKPLCKDKEVCLALTGSPIVKGPADLGALLDMIGQIEKFGGYFKFIKQYYTANKGFFNNSKALPQNLSDLNIKLRSICFIRREKFQVLKELPDKVRQIIKVDIDNQEEYDHALINLQSYLLSKNVDPEKIDAAMRAELLVQLGILKKLSARGKLSAVKQFVEDLLLQDKKLVIFTWFKETANFIKNNFDDVLLVTGDVSDEEVRDNIKKFQEDPKYKLIVLTYKRGGTGFTLTAASDWLCIEMGWTYKDQSQAEDREHRIGQKNNVNCYYFLGKGTVDERIYDIIITRMLMEREATGSRTEIQTEETTFKEIMKSLITKQNDN
jgi:SWI/SNF-related matrix-associated actin-dependent regulator 1 of chromatin subfamily A